TGPDEHRVARPGLDLLVTEPEAELPVEHVPALVVGVVDVQRGDRPLRARVAARVGPLHEDEAGAVGARAAAGARRAEPPRRLPEASDTLAAGRVASGGPHRAAAGSRLRRACAGAAGRADARRHLREAGAVHAARTGRRQRPRRAEARRPLLAPARPLERADP